MTAALDVHAWPQARLGELLSVLGVRARLGAHANEPPPIASAVGDAGQASVARWIEATCEWMGFDAEPISIPLRELEDTLARVAPAVIRLPGDEPRFLGLVRVRGRVEAIGLDHRARRIDLRALAGVLAARYDAELAPALDRLAERISPARRPGAREALRRELGADKRIDGVCLLRMSPGAPLWQRMRDTGLDRRLVGVAFGHLLQYLGWLASWWLLGRAALAGHLDVGWIIAWALLLASAQLLRVALLRAEARLAVAAGALLKQRLLLGTLRVETDRVRAQGVGELLGRVLESEAVEALALGGALALLEGGCDLIAAPVVLWLGAGGGLHVLLFALAFAGTAWLALRYYRDRIAWTDTRMAMTNDLVEAMVGHRTRLVQQPPDERDQDADRQLEGYLEVGGRMDRDMVRFRALVGRGWLVLGIAGMAPAFVDSTADVSSLALALAGVLLARRAFVRVSSALVDVVGAVVSFRAIAPLYRAASAPEAVGVPSFAIAPIESGSLLEAHDVTFRYGTRTEPALRDASLRVGHGDRVLLEGPSGGGKSTLVAVLAGMRVPEHGVLLLGGLDRATLGAGGWRSRIANAPQFHENHVMTETFAFNLLMGRAWPPSQAEMEEAAEICRELGLGPLLERMPAGMLQMVGDTGWQLSHGERSRLYIARALLQRADVVILDESFGALDPESARRALECVLARAKTLVVVAHP